MRDSDSTLVITVRCKVQKPWTVLNSMTFNVFLPYNRISFFLTRDGKSGDSKVIVSWSSINNHKNPEESEAIDEIIRLKSEGISLRNIANILNSAGVKPRRSAKWSHSIVAHIINNLE